MYINMFVDMCFSSTDRLRHDVRRPRLMLQSYRRDERDVELARVKRDRAVLRQRLEDTEWSLCQRAGEIALLKTQLKEAQVIYKRLDGV